MKRLDGVALHQLRMAASTPEGRKQLEEGLKKLQGEADRMQQRVNVFRQQIDAIQAILGEVRL